MTKPGMVVALLIATMLSADAIAIDRRDDYDIYEDEPYIYPGWICGECRDPEEYPGDFAGFAYNAYFGEDPWAFRAELGMPFRVYNLQLQWVVIWFENVLFDMPSLLPDTMDIQVRLPTGQIITFTVVQGGPDLPVGARIPITETSGCGCADSDGEEDADEFDDFGDFDDFEEPEPFELQGIVEILDPDEDGEFPDWDVEL